MTVDLGELEFLDLRGFRVLIRAEERLGGRGFTITNPPWVARRLYGLCGRRLPTDFEIREARGAGATRFAEVPQPPACQPELLCTPTAEQELNVLGP